MKHSLKITVIILVMFLVAQIIGLAVLTSYDNYFGKTSKEKIEAGEYTPPEVSIIKETVPPEIKLDKPIDVARIVMSIMIAIIIATVVFLLLSRIRITFIIKAWFTLVVFLCLSIALTLFLYPYFSTSLFNVFGKKIALAEMIAVPLAALGVFFKIFRRNIVVHNITELFIYPGLAVIFLPFLNVIAAAFLLVVISIYDMWAVWKSKYMIKLAEFQITKLKVFTGFFIPYIKPKDRAKIQKLRVMELRRIQREKKRKKEKKKKRKEKVKQKRKKKMLKIKVQIAALGGGDVAFTLIFAGTILFAYGLAAALITVLCTTLALTLLLMFSEKNKFYPAMPFLSAGCFLGWLLVFLLI